ncbi:hypothetical protein FA13DRAFT_1794505 [Coprinellus micaceus]|uniref:Uncharacterized protein n=1 Tax=Coprinellus micaceus TaxID=71717 RepID=A0A4Y7T1E0_COPMI|nr:hypothetical protein FA13DRAFT_1794505 [Coprinellus micaceus]
MLWLISSAVGDLAVAVSLVWHLIIRLIIRTGMVAAIFATLDVICFSHTTINFIWDFALEKLYTKTLTSTLNARTGWGRLSNGPAEHHLLFGAEPQGTATRGVDTSIMSVNLQFHQQGWYLELDLRRRALAELRDGIDEYDALPFHLGLGEQHQDQRLEGSQGLAFPAQFKG